MKTEYHFHIEGDSETIQKALNLLDGVIQTMSSKDGDHHLTWNPERGASPIEQIVQILQSGKRDDGILLLELFLSDDPNNEDVLYNLGMAVSDAGELTRAVDLLSRLVKQAPTHTNGRVALGVAYLRSRKMEAGIKELETAVSQEPDNLWARRNLGAGLIQAERFTEAVGHLRRATELAPTDQAAWFGYGQALQFNGEIKEADQIYIKVIGMDEFSDAAELARKSRSKIAEQGLHQATDGAPRMDAVMYCLSALQKFEKMPLEHVRQIGFEIALLGTHGLDVNSAEEKYTLKSLPGNYSGLHLVCLQYAAFKKIAPEQNIGFDVSAEYETAWKLFEKNTK